MINYAQRGRVVRVAYLASAIVCYVLSLGGRIGRGGVVVLCYHGVAREYRKSFARQMSSIARRSVSLADLCKAASYRFGARPRVCVTFDDAFENLLENAVPVLEELEVPATVFVVPGSLGRRPTWRMSPGHPEAKERLMDEAQIRSLVRNRGFQAESHTLTHANLPTLPIAEVGRELSESKAMLENVLGTGVTAIAFPYGACNDDILGEAKSAGYGLMCTLEPRVYARGDGAVVGRFSMSPDAWHIEFYLTCVGAYSWLCVWRRLLARARALLASRRKKGQVRP